MAWSTLLDSIKSSIKQNRNQEITGTVLQNVLVNMVNQLGANMTYAGLATPTTKPGAPNGPTFYIAVSAGTYTNFNGIKVAENEIALLKFYNNIWSKDTLLSNTSDVTRQSTDINLGITNAAGVYEATIKKAGWWILMSPTQYTSVALTCLYSDPSMHGITQILICNVSPANIQDWDLNSVTHMDGSVYIYRRRWHATNDDTWTKWEVALPGLMTYGSNGENVGEIFNNYIENAAAAYAHAEGYKTSASGKYSHAEGYSTKASGEAAHAEGRETVASGVNSHAEGTQTVAGPYSHAEGNLADASGGTAHAEGYKTKALGPFSHAEGSDCTCEAGAPRSHAEGFNTKTSAPNSHAEGNGSHVLSGGDAGHCEGCSTWVWSFAGHAEGNHTQAWDTAHAEGYLCQAQGTISHAGGYGSVSSGYSSFAHGLAINTVLDYEVSFGKYNANGPRTAFSIGIGTAEGNRKNAVEVTTSGNTYLYGVGGYDGTNADGAVPINQLDRPTRSTVNMNDCLQTGFYPWCTLGRPAGATGAFSLSVRRASTPDGNGFYTVEQTCYGREAELGQVWTRMVFDKGGSTSPDTDYMEWIRVDGGGQEGGMDPEEAKALLLSTGVGVCQWRDGNCPRVVEIDSTKLPEDRDYTQAEMDTAGITREVWLDITEGLVASLRDAHSGVYAFLGYSDVARFECPLAGNTGDGMGYLIKKSGTGTSSTYNVRFYTKTGA